MKARNNNRKSQYKARPKSHWKKNLKDQCFRRIKEQRLNLFTKLRQAHIQNHTHDSCNKNSAPASSFSFNGNNSFAIGTGGGNNDSVSSSVFNNNAFMMDSNNFNRNTNFNNNYKKHNTKSNNSVMSLASCGVISSDLNSILASEVRRMKTHCTSDVESNALSQQEFELLVREMEEALMMEIKENEQELVAAFEKDISRVQDALDADIEDYYCMKNSQEKPGGGRLLCPVCTYNYIYISNESGKTIIQCSCGIHFQMKMGTLGIQEMNATINQSLHSHKKNCMAKPSFKYCKDNSIESTAMEDIDEDPNMAGDFLNGIFLVCTRCQHFKSVFH